MVSSQATSSENQISLGVEYQPPHNSQGPGLRAPMRPRLVRIAMQGHSEVGSARVEYNPQWTARMARSATRGQRTWC